jgi:hypothetical protein
MTAPERRVRIELDSVRKDRNGSEWRMVGRARSEGFESVGDGHNIKAVCAQLRDAGFDGDCEVWRGDTPVFSAMPISAWADGKALTGEQPEHLRRQS